MTDEEREVAETAIRMARVTAPDGFPKFHGWFSYSGRWIARFDGGRWVWVNGAEWGFDLDT